MAKKSGKSIIDPIDRIEGHLRIEMEVEDGVVTDAWVSGGLFRGVELIVQGRQPTDASLVVQRICGVCPTSHCHASTYAAEAAYGVIHPEGARMVRNLLEGAQYMHSHILWFYQLNALDYVNPLNALEADPAKANEVARSLGLAERDYQAVYDRLQTFAENGQYSWLSGGWFMEGQAPDNYALPPEVNLIAVAHYIEGIDMQAQADEISAIIGGKMPHTMTSRPGGTAFYPNIERLDDILFRIKKIKTFINEVLVPDAIAIASVYVAEDDRNNPLLFGNNKHGNFMSYGVFDRKAVEEDDGTKHYDATKRYIPSGIVRFDPDTKLPMLEKFDYTKIEEQIKHSYYDPYEGDKDSLPPLEGQTNPPTGEVAYDIDDKYSWAKAPRYDGDVMEVGPLARMIVAYCSGVDEVVESTNDLLVKVGLISKNAGEEEIAAALYNLNSAAGRLLARPIEDIVVINWMEEWVNELVAYLKDGGNEFWTDEGKSTTNEEGGVGLWEAPRGALLHCEKIKNDKITHYQAVVPTAWNISPRGNQDDPGTIEQCLIGTPVDNLDAPINALRIVHGYDPCIACAIHIVEPKTGKEFRMNTTPWGGR